MLTEPLLPNPETGLPVFAFSAIRRPSLVPKNKAAGDWLSPAQYSRPRVDALMPPRSAIQICLPVSGSNATTLPLGVGKYIIPPATIGVVSARPPPPPPPRPRPAPAPAGGVAGGVAAESAEFMWNVQARVSLETLVVSICFRGE